jgi:hypothetical protein
MRPRSAIERLGKHRPSTLRAGTLTAPRAATFEVPNVPGEVGHRSVTRAELEEVHRRQPSSSRGLLRVFAWCCPARLPLGTDRLLGRKRESVRRKAEEITVSGVRSDTPKKTFDSDPRGRLSVVRLCGDLPCSCGRL